MTFKWLSGKHFVTETYLNCAGMEKIKEQTMTVAETEMSLADVYRQLLPWNLNAKSILIFHNNLLHHLGNTMDTYLYQHVVYIIMYLEFVNQESATGLEFLVETIRWFESGTRVFYDHLSLSGTYQHIGNVELVIAVIRYGDKSNLNIAIENVISSTILEDLKAKAWVAFNNAVNNSPADVQLKEILHKMMLDNCTEAIMYVNHFIWILNTSTVMINAIDYLNTNIFCD